MILGLDQKIIQRYVLKQRKQKIRKITSNSSIVASPNSYFIMYKFTSILHYLFNLLDIANYL